MVFSSNFNSLVTNFPAFIHFAHFKINSSLVCQECDILSIEFKSFVVVRKCFFEVLLLVNIII